MDSRSVQTHHDPRDKSHHRLAGAFDRLKNRGRVGTATLYWLAMDRSGDVQVSAPEVLSRLHAEGLVDATSVDTVTLVHAFSAAIGNTDAHLGNYGLIGITWKELLRHLDDGV